MSRSCNRRWTFMFVILSSSSYCFLPLRWYNSCIFCSRSNTIWKSIIITTLYSHILWYVCIRSCRSCFHLTVKAVLFLPLCSIIVTKLHTFHDVFVQLVIKRITWSFRRFLDPCCISNNRFQVLKRSLRGGEKWSVSGIINQCTILGWLLCQILIFHLFLYKVSWIFIFVKEDDVRLKSVFLCIIIDKVLPIVLDSIILAAIILKEIFIKSLKIIMISW